MTDWIRKGHPVVAVGESPNGPPVLGDTVHIERVTETLILTSDGGRYSRKHLHPVAWKGWRPRLQLRSAYDDTVMVIRAQQHLAEIGKRAENLAKLDRKVTTDVLADLALIERAAHDARKAVIDLMTAADRAQQE